MLTKKIPATSAGTKLQNKEKPAVRELLTAGVVDLEGLEPLTSRMRTERSPNCATGPNALDNTIVYQKFQKCKALFSEACKDFWPEILASSGEMLYHRNQSLPDASRRRAWPH